MSNRPNLAQLLIEANRKAEQERADKLQVERIAKDVQARIAAAAEKAKLAHRRIHAEGDDDLVCPSCGYKGPEADFEPDNDGDADDKFRTNPVTSGTDNEDDQNVGDGAKVPKYDNRKLTPLQRALKSKGIDPFAED